MGGEGALAVTAVLRVAFGPADIPFPSCLPGTSPAIPSPKALQAPPLKCDGPR